jgi:TorA maturation chaperone TorD
MGSETHAILAARRSAWYWLLAELFLTCPNDAFVARWRGDLAFDAGAGGEPAGPVAAEVAALHAALPDADDKPGTTGLAVEYTRLFGAVRTGYGPPPPYESVHRKAMQPGDLVVALNRFYNEAGLAPVDHAVPSDHLGVELKFVALLCHAEMEAWQQERAGDARQVLGRQREFFGRHLLPWAPDYLDAVQADTQHPFYRCLALLAHKIISEDHTAVDARNVS